MSTSALDSHQLCYVQNEVESQYMDLLSQSHADMSVGNNDEGDVERDLREMNQQLLQMQQELMHAQAEYDLARASEEEALHTWESKRSTCTLVILFWNFWDCTAFMVTAMHEHLQYYPLHSILALFIDLTLEL